MPRRGGGADIPRGDAYLCASPNPAGLTGAIKGRRRRTARPLSQMRVTHLVMRHARRGQARGTVSGEHPPHLFPWERVASAQQKCGMHPRGVRKRTGRGGLNSTPTIRTARRLWPWPWNTTGTGDDKRQKSPPVHSPGKKPHRGKTKEAPDTRTPAHRWEGLVRPFGCLQAEHG